MMPFVIKTKRSFLAVTLPETNSSHLKMDGWHAFSSPFGMAYFQGRTVSFRECMNPTC